MSDLSDDHSSNFFLSPLTVSVKPHNEIYINVHITRSYSYINVWCDLSQTMRLKPGFHYPSWRVTGFHYPSTRAVLKGACVH